jgi:hypothetical protein
MVDVLRSKQISTNFSGISWAIMVVCSTAYYVNRTKSSMGNAKGLRKNEFAELALRFGSDLADPIEQNPINSELFRGV